MPDNMPSAICTIAALLECALSAICTTASLLDCALCRWRCSLRAVIKINFCQVKPLFQHLKISDQVPDLIWLEAELWHGGMACGNAFGEGFFEMFNRIAFVKIAKGRCN